MSLQERGGEPSASEPLLSELPSSKPLLCEQTVSELPATEPLLCEQTANEPLVGELPASDPLLREQTASEPLVCEQAASEPLVCEQTESEPLLCEQAANEPLLSELPASEPLVCELPATEPLICELPANGSLICELPANGPLVSELPASEPLVCELPATEPLICELLPPNELLSCELSASEPLACELPANEPLVYGGKELDLPTSTISQNHAKAVVNNAVDMFNNQEEMEIYIESAEVEPTTVEVLSFEPAMKKQKRESNAEECNVPLENIKGTNITSGMHVLLEIPKPSTQVVIEKNSCHIKRMMEINAIEGKFCSVDWCFSTSMVDESIKFYCFPSHDKDLCKQWIRYCEDESLYQLPPNQLLLRKICEKHFSDNCFIKKILKNTASPIPVTPLDDELFLSETSRDHVSKALSKGQIVCSYLGCKSIKSIDSVQFYNFPIHNNELLYKWTHYCDEQFLPNLTKSELSNRAVCEKHFTDDSFEEASRKIMKGNAIPNIPRNNNDVVIQTPPPKLYTKVSRPVQQVDCPNSSEIEIETCQQKVSNEEIKDDLTSVDTSFTTVRAPVRTYKRTAPKRQHTASIQGQTKNEEQEIRQVAKFEISEKSNEDANQGFEIVRVQDLERKKGIEDRYKMNDIEINVNINDLLTSSEKEPSTLISTLLEKLHSCFYCNDLVADMKTHLVLQHPKKKEVLSALAFGKHKKEKMLTLLTRVGDFKHNCRVLEANTGFLICLGGWHHTFFTIDKSKFLPCPLCAAFIHIDCFTHHNECCMFKDVSETKVQEPEKNLLMKSQAMLSHLKKSEVKKLKDHYFYRLKGIFGSLAKNDELIMWIVSYLFINERCREEGLVLLTRLGFIVHLYSRVTGNSEGVKFENILRPDSVYALFEALRYFLREATGTGTTNLYKQLYSHISISAFVWRGECLFRGDLDAAKDAINFFDVFNNMYEKELKSDPTLQLKLSTQREVSYKRSKKKKPVVDVSNIERLKNLLNESIVKLTDALCSKAISNEAKAVWHELAADTLCYLCLTNPVDFTTIEQISVIEYALRPDSSIQNLVKCNKMMPLLFKFSERCTFVITVHHNSEIVIILSSAVKNAIDTLLKKRQEAGVSLTHRYIFSGCSGSDTRTLSALNCFCNLCLNQKEGLSPDVLGNWKKRRLISNIIHISEMPPKELESVKKYLESSRDNQSTLQIDNEENQEFEMREELEEALKIYEFSQSNQEIVFSDETSCSSESSVKGESSPTQ